MLNPFRVAPRSVQWASVILFSLPVFDIIVALLQFPIGEVVERQALSIPFYFLFVSIGACLLWGMNLVRLLFLAVVLYGGWAKLELGRRAGFMMLGGWGLYETVWLTAPVASLVLCFLPASNRYFLRSRGPAGQASAPDVHGEFAPAVTTRWSFRRMVWGACLITGAAVAALYAVKAIRQGAAIDRGHQATHDSIYREAAERESGNNLRLLATAASQYYFENRPGTPGLADLVGRDRFLIRLVPVAGEEYPKTFPRGADLVATFPDGIQIVYSQTTGEIRRVVPGSTPSHP